MGNGGKPNVGIRLRTFRERRGWSLRMLSERCGLSINAISRIERSENSPTVSSLTRLAGALAVPITDFFLDGQARAVDFGRRGEGESFQGPGFIAQKLNCSPQNRQLEPYLVSILPECDGSGSPISHPGEEFIFCISGRLDFCIGEKIYHLRQGDSLLFASQLPHFWQNAGAEPAEVLMIFQAALDNTLARANHLPT